MAINPRTMEIRKVRSALGIKDRWFFRDYGYRKLDIFINSCKQWIIVFVEKQKKFLRALNEKQI